MIGVFGEPIVDDGGQEEAEGVKAAKNSKVRQCTEPDLQVEDTAPDFCPIKTFMFGTRSAETEPCMFFLSGSEEAGGLDRIRQEDGRAQPNEDCKQALNDEYPAPAFESSSRSDCIKAAGE